MQIHHIKNSFPIYIKHQLSLSLQKINLLFAKKSIYGNQKQKVGEVTFIGNASVLCICN